MTIRDIISLLDAEIISAADLDLEVKTACGSDMMSDVLAFVKDQSVLLTGLLNPQVVRTAEMMDMRCIVFVRGKQPDDSIVELSRSGFVPAKSLPDKNGDTHPRFHLGTMCLPETDQSRCLFQSWKTPRQKTPAASESLPQHHFHLLGESHEPSAG